MKLQAMKQQCDTNFKRDSKGFASGQKTRRSMIVRQQNPPAIYQPNIQDILALQMSDTLINAAYNLSVYRITVSIKKLCDPLEKMFFQKKCKAFECIKIFSNRSKIFLEHNFANTKKKQFFQKKSSQLSQIDLLQQSKLNHQMQEPIIILTKYQQQQKVVELIRAKLEKMVKILIRSQTKIKFTAILNIQNYDFSNSSPKKEIRNQIQQVFKKYDQSRIDGRKFHRRSIDKQPLKKQSNQYSFSLNKNNQQLTRVLSPTAKYPQQSKNLLYTYAKIGTDKKASTCSQTQSNNSQKDQSPQKYYYSKSNTAINSLHGLSGLRSSNPIYSSNRMQESKVTSLNGSFFAEGTKQRQLQILRSKYYRLVEQFKDFSERFLQVIKEQ